MTAPMERPSFEVCPRCGKQWGEDGSRPLSSKCKPCNLHYYKGGVGYLYLRLPECGVYWLCGGITEIYGTKLANVGVNYKFDECLPYDITYDGIRMRIVFE